MKRLLCIAALIFFASAFVQASNNEDTLLETEVTSEDSHQQRYDLSKYNILEECEPFDALKVMKEWVPIDIVVTRQNTPAKMYRAWYVEKKSPHKSGFFRNPETSQIVLVMTTNGHVTVYGFRDQKCYFN